MRDFAALDAASVCKKPLFWIQLPETPSLLTYSLRLRCAIRTKSYQSQADARYNTNRRYLLYFLLSVLAPRLVGGSSPSDRTPPQTSHPLID